MITRDMYIRRQEIIRIRMMKLFIPKVYAALQSQIKDAVHVIKQKGLTAAQGNINGHILNAHIGAVVKGLYRTAAHAAASKFQYNKKAFGSDEDFIQKVLDYFSRHLLENVVLPISQTTVDQIETVLQKAIAEGWGVDKTVKQLEDSDITKQRARTIVRTETIRATNFTQMAAADNEDFQMEKQWIAIEDNRTRDSHSHKGVDGERIDLDAKFSNGLLFPGDPEGDAEDVINCRCTLGYFAKRDLEGNLVPKSRDDLDLFMKMSANTIK